MLRHPLYSFRRRGFRSSARADWTPARWSSSQLFHWFHGGVPSAGLSSTIQGGVGNTTTGWNDASGNGRHVSATINGTPNVIKPNQLEAINFARGDAEYLLQTGYNATSDADGTYFMLIRVLTGDLENADLFPCGFGASGSGSRVAYTSLFSTGGECTPRIYVQNGIGNNASAYPSATANRIVPNTVHSLIWEANGTADTYRIWVDEVEITSLTTAVNGTGVLGNWWAYVNSGSQLNRFAIGTVPTNSGVNANYFNGAIFEIGARRGVLGSDESNLLGHLTRQRAAA